MLTSNVYMSTLPRSLASVFLFVSGVDFETLETFCLLLFGFSFDSSAFPSTLTLWLFSCQEQESSNPQVGLLSKAEVF